MKLKKKKRLIKELKGIKDIKDIKGIHRISKTDLIGNRAIVELYINTTTSSDILIYSSKSSNLFLVLVSIHSSFCCV